LRRTNPATPRTPVPNIASEDGSGTGHGLGVPLVVAVNVEVPEVLFKMKFPETVLKLNQN
jgi:hypothetical protein